MKRLLILFAALTVSFVSCSNKSEEAIEAEYNAELEAISQSYDAGADILETIGKIKEASYNVIKKYPSSATALMAFRTFYTYCEEGDLDMLEEIAGKLKGENAKAEVVQDILSASKARKNSAVGVKFTDFTVIQDPTNPEASTVKLSDYVGKGKFILVDFWASWCQPCRMEIPNIASVYEKYHGDRFDVLSVAVADKVEDTKAAAAELGIIWNQIVNAQSVPQKTYGIDSIPRIFLFSPDGILLKNNLRGAEVEEAVREALGR